MIGRFINSSTVWEGAISAIPTGLITVLWRDEGELRVWETRRLRGNWFKLMPWEYNSRLRETCGDVIQVVSPSFNVCILTLLKAEKKQNWYIEYDGLRKGSVQTTTMAYKVTTSYMSLSCTIHKWTTLLPVKCSYTLFNQDSPDHYKQHQHKYKSTVVCGWIPDLPLQSLFVRTRHQGQTE